VKKSGILFAVVGGLIGIGMLLSAYGNYVIFEDLAKGDGDVKSGQNLVVEIDLDSTDTQTGIYAVQIIDFKGATITANILDPSDIVIESQSVNEEVYEGLFELTSSGVYKLSIENEGEQIKIFGVIGPEPDDWKRSMGLISMYILFMGLIGMAGLAVYLVINRKKDAS
jgi:hypothetical protein